MKKIYLAKYGQSRFGNLGNYPIESMIRDAGAAELRHRPAPIEHVAIAGLLTPTLNAQLLLAGLVAMDPVYTDKSIKAVANACDSGGLAVLDCATPDPGRAGARRARHRHRENAPARGQARLQGGRRGARRGRAQGRSVPALTFPHAFAVIMDRYMKTYGYSEEDFACIPPLFYDNAATTRWRTCTRPRSRSPRRRCWGAIACSRSRRCRSSSSSARRSPTAGHGSWCATTRG